MKNLDSLSDTSQHAFAIEAEAKEGVGMVKKWAEEKLGMKVEANPDVITRTYGLLAVEEARQVAELSYGAPFVGEYKVVIIAANRIYHEAQNALLKVFEEPPKNTYLFLIMPTLGSMLPTLRSRVQVFKAQPSRGTSKKSEDDSIVKQFLAASREKRSALIKKLATGKDDEDRRKNREEAIAILNGIEQMLVAKDTQKHARTLAEISTLRAYLYDRSAPVRMILEHLALVIPVGVR